MCVNKNENKNTKKKRTEGKILEPFWPLRSIYRFPIQKSLQFCCYFTLLLPTRKKKLKLKRRKIKHI